MSEIIKKRKFEEVLAKTQTAATAFEQLIRSTNDLIAIQDTQLLNRLQASEGLDPAGDSRKPLVEAFLATSSCQFCYSQVRTRQFKSCSRGHLFHTACIEQMEAALGYGEKMRCGLCGNVETTVGYNQPMAGIIEAYYTFHPSPCENEIEGCRFEGRIFELRQHERYCSKRKLTCRSLFKIGDREPFGCVTIVSPSEMRPHLQGCLRPSIMQVC